MSDEDIEKAVKEAAQYEAEDKKKKDAIDARNEADSLAFQTEKAMQEAGDKLDPSQKSTVEADLADLKAVLDRTKDQTEISDADVDELKTKQQKLSTDAQALFTKMYEQAAQQNQQAGGQAGPGAGAGTGTGSSNAGSGNNGGKDDDVVDGDYREV